MKFLIISIIIEGVAIMLLTQHTVLAETNIKQVLNETREQTASLKDGRFRHEENVLDISTTEYAATTWDFFFKDNERIPKTALPRKPVDLSHFNASGPDQLNATWLGHSSIMINIDGYRILTDPVFEKKVSIVGPIRFNGDLPLNIEELPQIDVVIISHDHYDHLNKHSVKFLADKTKKFIVPLGVGSLLAKWGVEHEKIKELNWWDELNIDDHLMVAATPSQHFSGRGLFDRNKSLWASWVIKTRFHKVFFSGDSGYFKGFKKIGEKYGPFDMTFIECGAYNKSWALVHMFPEQTVQAHLDLKGDVLHPIHWGTFNLSLHQWYEPMQRLNAAADFRHVKIATPIVGDTTLYGNTLSASRWWEAVMK